MSPQEVVFRRGLFWSSVAILAVAAAGGVIGWLVAGSAGLGSALGGAAASAVFGLTTQVAAAVTVKRDPLVFVGAVAASSMVKILLVIVAALVAQRFDSLVAPVFGGVLLVGALSALAIDIVIYVRGRIPYVSESAQNPRDGVG